MRCPGCNQEVPENTAICGHCDYIIDKSFLGSDFTDLQPAAEPEQGVTACGEPPRPSSNRRPANRAEDEDVGDRPRPRSARRCAQDTPVDSSSAPPADNLVLEGSRVTEDVQDTLKSIWGGFTALTLPDKLAVGGAAGMFVFSFFPWVGEEIGFEVGGLFCALLVAVTVALVLMRQHRHWRDKEKYIIYLQAGIGVFAVLFTISKMLSLGKTAPVIPNGSMQVPVVSRLGAGLFLCFLSAAAMLGGALLLLKGKAYKRG